MIIVAYIIKSGKYDKLWEKYNSTYRIADNKNLKKTGLFAFTINTKEEIPIISGDDGKEYYLITKTENLAQIYCNETTLFYNKPLIINESGGIYLDRILYINKK